MTTLAAWRPDPPVDPRLANVAALRAGYAALRAYGPTVVGARLVPVRLRGELHCRAVPLRRAECFGRVERLELIRQVDLRIRRLRRIFDLLRELRELGAPFTQDGGE